MTTAACPTDLLPLAAAGTLPVGDQEHVETHAEACPACADELAEWRQIAVATIGAETAAQPRPAAGPGIEDGAAEPLGAGAADPDGVLLTPFAHLAWPKAARYRRILDVFAHARDGFIVHLRPEDVAAALGEPADDRLSDDLDKLARAGNLRTTPDTSRVTTVADFTRRRLLYALTREGEAVETAISTYVATLSRRAELQAVALQDIREGLRALINLAEADTPDPSRTAATLRDLEAVFGSLADNAAAFMASLSRSIDAAAGGVDAFLAYKDRLIGYLQRFIGDLVVASAEIGASLRTLDELAVDRLLAAAATRQAADAAPDGEDARTEAARDHLDAWRARWTGLRRWFLGQADAPSQAELLRARARAAIPDLLESVALLHERRAGRSDRVADFVTLARWFAQAPTEADAHRLWRVAFGLASARHLTVDGDTIDQRLAEPVPPTTAWADAPRVSVSARLRQTGSWQRRGPVRSADRGTQRAALAQRLARERLETAAAQRRLATGQPTRLSDLDLDLDTFPVFLQLLGDVLGAARPGQPVETTTADGSLRIRLEPAGDHRTAEIPTPEGVLRGPDHELTITDAYA